ANEDRQEIHDLESFLPGGLRHLQVEVAERIAGPPVRWDQGKDDHQDPRSPLPGEGPDFPEGGDHALPLLAVGRVEIADVVPYPVPPDVTPVPSQMYKPQAMREYPQTGGSERPV